MKKKKEVQQVTLDLEEDKKFRFRITKRNKERP